MKKQKKIDYEIYCLYHNKINKEYYGNQINKLTFVKLDCSEYVFPAKKQIVLLNETFSQIGKEWAEYEFYYYLYKKHKKGEIKLPEYLGFIQYDMEFKSKQIGHKDESIIDFIEKLINENKLNPKTMILFNPEPFMKMWKQNIIMAPKRPDLKNDSSFENCFETIIKEYNFLEKKNIQLSDLKNKNLAMCGAFLVHKSVFIKLMDFLSIIIESKKLEIYDKTNRMQGNFAERYAAIFLEAMNLNKIEFPVVHYFSKTLEMPLHKKIIWRINKNIGKLGILIRKLYAH